MLTRAAATGNEPPSDYALATGNSESRYGVVIEHVVAATSEARAAVGFVGQLQVISRNACALLGVSRCIICLRLRSGELQAVAGHDSGGALDLTDDRYEIDVRGQLAGNAEGQSIGPSVIDRIDFVNLQTRPSRLRSWGETNLVAVHLCHGTDVIGMMFLDDDGHNRGYSSAALDSVGKFGQLLTPYIRHAKDTGRAVALARRNEVLEHVNGLHGRLTRIINDGADMSDIVTVLSELAGKPVILLDPNLRVRFWAAPEILGLESPPAIPPNALQAPSLRDAVARLGTESPATTIPPQPGIGISRRHLLRILVADGRAVGYLDIAEMGVRLKPVDATIAEQGASVLSLLLHAETQRAEIEGPARDDFILDLLRGNHNANQLARRSNKVGFDLSQPHVIIRFAVSPDYFSRRNEALVSILGAVDGILAGGRGVEISVPEAIVVIVPANDAAGEVKMPRLRNHLSRSLDRIARCTGIRRAVVSPPCRRVGDYATAAHEIGELDKIMAATGGSGIAMADDLGVLRVLVAGGRIDRAIRFAEDFMEPLMSSDARTGGQLVATFRSYLASGAQVKVTAATLGVHENTVRYRLDRIAEIAGMTMRSFPSLLKSELAFQLLEITGRLPIPASGPETSFS